MDCDKELDPPTLVVTHELPVETVSVLQDLLLLCANATEHELPDVVTQETLVLVLRLLLLLEKHLTLALPNSSTLVLHEIEVL